MEAILANPGAEAAPQAGRPFAITDPNPPIRYQDLWFLVETLSITGFRTIPVPPIFMFLLSYVIEAYCLLPVRFLWLRHVLPALKGDIKHLKPPLFSVATHLYANGEAAKRPVKDGGLGYRGVITTLEGMCQELVEWNQEHVGLGSKERRKYRSSVLLAEEIQKVGSAAATLKD